MRSRAANSADRLRAAVESLGSKLTAAGEPAATVSIGFVEITDLGIAEAAMPSQGEGTIENVATVREIPRAS